MTQPSNTRRGFCFCFWGDRFFPLGVETDSARSAVNRIRILLRIFLLTNLAWNFSQNIHRLVVWKLCMRHMSKCNTDRSAEKSLRNVRKFYCIVCRRVVSWSWRRGIRARPHRRLLHCSTVLHCSMLQSRSVLQSRMLQCSTLHWCGQALTKSNPTQG